MYQKITKKVQNTAITYKKTVLYPTFQWLDRAMSNSPMAGKGYFEQCNSWTVLCPTIQQLISVAFNCPMVGQCCAHFSMVGLSCVQLFNSHTVLCETVQWSDSALSKIILIFYSLKQEVLILLYILVKCPKTYTEL